MTTHETTDQLSLPPPGEVQPDYAESFAEYKKSLEILGQNIPEITQNIDSILTGAAALIEDFGITPQLFMEPGRSLVFTALAKKRGDILLDHKQTSEDDNEFVEASLSLLARNYSDKPARDESDGTPEPDYSDQYKLGVYDKYTHKGLTERLRTAIDNGMLDAVKQRLKITTDNEQPYEVRVLGVASDNLDAFGLSAPPLAEELGQNPFLTNPEGKPKENPREFFAKLKEHQELVNQVKSYVDGCVKRGLEFAGSLGNEKLTSPAWVVTIGDRRLLCINMPLAEKLLDPELTKHMPYYDQDNRNADMAILEHEYTHTQGGLSIDNDIFFGIGLEELRAEYFSGNKQGYQDVKGLFLDISVITGYHPYDLFSQIPLGGNVQEHFSKLANVVGLDNLAEVLMAAPRPYLNNQPNRFMNRAFASFRGYDGITSRLLARQRASGDTAGIAERVGHRVKVLRSVGDPEWILNYRRTFGHNTVTDLVEAMYYEITAKSDPIK